MTLFNYLARVFREMSNNHYMKYRNYTNEPWDLNMAKFYANVSSFFWKISRKD